MSTPIIRVEDLIKHDGLKGTINLTAGRRGMREGWGARTNVVAAIDAIVFRKLVKNISKNTPLPLVNFTSSSLRRMKTTRSCSYVHPPSSPVPKHEMGCFFY